MTAKHPAAFINAIADEGTKTEAVEWLQRTWDELCDLRHDMERHMTALAAETNARIGAENRLEAALNAEREHLSAFEAQHARATAEFDKRIDAERRLDAALAELAGARCLASPDGRCQIRRGQEFAGSPLESVSFSDTRCQGGAGHDCDLPDGHDGECRVVETPSFIAKALGGENQVLKHLLKKESE